MVVSIAAIIAAVSGPTPPLLAVPSLGDAWLGWITSIAILLGPTFFSLLSWHRRHGHWWYFLRQWNTLGFWLALIGSIAAASGMFGIMGLIPVWQTRWTDWFVAIVAANPGYLTTLLWLQDVQREYVAILQLSAAIVFLVGAAGLVLGLSRLSRRMAVFRVGPDEWLVADADADAVKRTPASRGLN